MILKSPSNQKVDVVYLDDSDKKKASFSTQLEPTVPVEEMGNYKTRNIVIIIIFIALIIIVICLSSNRKGSALYDHRPSTADESGVLV